MTLFKKPVLLTLCGVFSLFFFAPLFSLTLQEKRAMLAEEPQGGGNDMKSTLKKMNLDLQEKKEALLKLNIQTDQLLKAVPPGQVDAFFTQKLPELQKAQNAVTELETNWKELSKKLANDEDEALWHQPDTTIGQLVIDYGSLDHVYLMPPEIANLKIHVSSQLTVPRASWNEMIEQILASYGIGVKQMNTFVRQLFFLRLNQSGPSAICENMNELQAQPLNARVLLIISPPPADSKRIFGFLEKFVPQEQVNFQMAGSSIVALGYVKELLELMKIYQFMSRPSERQDYKLVTLQKAHAEEVASILHSIFDGESSGRASALSDNKHHLPFFPSDNASTGFRVTAMKHPAQSLFLMGKPDQLEKALAIIQDIENRVGEVREKTLFWYACKHSEAEDLAKVLSPVYQKMISAPEILKNGQNRPMKREPRAQPRENSEDIIEKLVVNPPYVGPGIEPGKRPAVEVHDNFIVDSKTNSIVMVVEAYLLDKIKELLKTLDVPKKMVQIDILMVEKKITDNNNFGMNLLKLADSARKKDTTNLTWNNTNKKGSGKGILDYAVSRHSHGFLPSYDISFNFLLQQQDVRINANPTVTTINQTTTKIAFVDEISINTGVVEIDTTKATRLKNSYVRAQYGITIQITPTIHAKIDTNAEDADQKYITLATDIAFDTPESNHDNRPDVIRRNIKNEVRVGDGETVILGGLRRKMAADNRDSIPFLGELPGVGKFFSTTTMHDTSSEMFIFITPRIIPEPSEQFIQMRKEQLSRRPGDIPEFLQEVERAKRQDKKKICERSFEMLFGRSTSSTRGTTIP